MTRYCECGQRIYVKSRQGAALNHGRGLDGSGLDKHDLCNRCWRELLNRVYSLERVERTRIRKNAEAADARQTA